MAAEEGREERGFLRFNVLGGGIAFRRAMGLFRLWSGEGRNSNIIEQTNSLKGQNPTVLCALIQI